MLCSNEALDPHGWARDQVRGNFALIPGSPKGTGDHDGFCVYLPTLPCATEATVQFSFVTGRGLLELHSLDLTSMYCIHTEYYREKWVLSLPLSRTRNLTL